jgi:hypothetical protein
MFVKKLTLTDLQLAIQLMPTHANSINGMLKYPGEFDYHGYGLVNSSMDAVTFTLNSLDMPAWILLKDHTAGSLENISVIIKHICEIKERLGFLQYYTVFDVDELAFMIQVNDRYIPYLEHKISPNKLTGYESVDHDILRFQKYDKEMFVHLWVLKDEYRIK